ncbi:hypothetical protein CANARDRAFT_28479 [[Candida] arabinofermentans NRRL YB-2248]|uniref:Inhibitor of apoptosis repeat-containing protein n=1 Tax=[Candida] arabinofermentans NRRL YB-2248 TaxID=983967 RepID=A0A1E4T0C6_9ASCO|nr:hypothetical protein CANARDRAFT_28479 [[Candida] arabinofermentans NRRL YB-2248]
MKPRKYKERTELLPRGGITNKRQARAFTSLEERENSFNGVFKNGELSYWPLITPSAADLAMNGFFFDPTRTYSDRVGCFSCKVTESNWAVNSTNSFYQDGEEHPPVFRHLRNSPDCSFANILAARYQRQHGELVNWQDSQIFKDPVASTQIRLKTFAKKWPYDLSSKHKSYPSGKQLAENGFYYSSHQPGDDAATCMYCGTSLESWDEGDDVEMEHKKRSPDCYIFNYKEILANKKTDLDVKKIASQRRSISGPKSYSLLPKRQSSIGISSSTTVENNVDLSDNQIGFPYHEPDAYIETGTADEDVPKSDVYGINQSSNQQVFEPDVEAPLSPGPLAEDLDDPVEIDDDNSAEKSLQAEKIPAVPTDSNQENKRLDSLEEEIIEIDDLEEISLGKQAEGKTSMIEIPASSLNELEDLYFIEDSSARPSTFFNKNKPSSAFASSMNNTRDVEQSKAESKMEQKVWKANAESSAQVKSDNITSAQPKTVEKNNLKPKVEEVILKPQVEVTEHHTELEAHDWKPEMDYEPDNYHDDYEVPALPDAEPAQKVSQEAESEVAPVLAITQCCDHNGTDSKLSENDVKKSIEIPERSADIVSEVTGLQRAKNLHDVLQTQSICATTDRNSSPIEQHNSQSLEENLDVQSQEIKVKEHVHHQEAGDVAGDSQISDVQSQSDDDMVPSEQVDASDIGSQLCGDVVVEDEKIIDEEMQDEEFQRSNDNIHLPIPDELEPTAKKPELHVENALPQKQPSPITYDLSEDAVVSEELQKSNDNTRESFSELQPTAKEPELHVENVLPQKRSSPTTDDLSEDVVVISKRSNRYKKIDSTSSDDGSVNRPDRVISRAVFDSLLSTTDDPLSFVGSRKPKAKKRRKKFKSIKKSSAVKVDAEVVIAAIAEVDIAPDEKRQSVSESERLSSKSVDGNNSLVSNAIGEKLELAEKSSASVVNLPKKEEIDPIPQLNDEEQGQMKLIEKGASINHDSEEQGQMKLIEKGASISHDSEESDDDILLDNHWSGSPTRRIAFQSDSEQRTAKAELQDARDIQLLVQVGQELEKSTTRVPHSQNTSSPQKGFRGNEMISSPLIRLKRPNMMPSSPTALHKQLSGGYESTVHDSENFGDDNNPNLRTSEAIQIFNDYENRDSAEIEQIENHLSIHETPNISKTKGMVLKMENIAENQSTPAHHITHDESNSSPTRESSAIQPDDIDMRISYLDDDDTKVTTWCPIDVTQVQNHVIDFKHAAQYVKEVLDSRYSSLNDDLDYTLTNFISEMPEDELEMTIKDWIFYHADQASKLVKIKAEQMLQNLRADADRALEVLKNLPEFDEHSAEDDEIIL